MSKAAQSKKSAEYAQYMKKAGIKRTASMCPMGCGAKITNGGPALISHLGRCNGKRR